MCFFISKLSLFKCGTFGFTAATSAISSYYYLSCGAEVFRIIGALGSRAFYIGFLFCRRSAENRVFGTFGSSVETVAVCVTACLRSASIHSDIRTYAQVALVVSTVCYIAFKFCHKYIILSTVLIYCVRF